MAGAMRLLTRAGSSAGDGAHMVRCHICVATSATVGPQRRAPSSPPTGTPSPTPDSSITLRFTPRSVIVAAALLAAACTSEGPTATGTGADPLLSRGSSGSATVIQVAGTWAGTTVNTTSAGDSTQWSLTLRQNGDRLEGGLIRIVYLNGASF